MSILTAVISGVISTLVFSMVLYIAPKMGMPKMDIVGILGSMFKKEGNPLLGLFAHSMMGILFAVVYILLWSFGVGSPSLENGLIFGAIH